ncbi:hypothetical protein GQR58_029635 [Nymphon striatum]|nr:hypothetical protein GQR58_029635 [Nymphon striatum]
MVRGVKALLTSRRSRVWSGGSMPRIDDRSNASLSPPTASRKISTVVVVEQHPAAYGRRMHRIASAHFGEVRKRVVGVTRFKRIEEQGVVCLRHRHRLEVQTASPIVRVIDGELAVAGRVPIFAGGYGTPCDKRSGWRCAVRRSRRNANRRNRLIGRDRRPRRGSRRGAQQSWPSQQRQRVRNEIRWGHQRDAPTPVLRTESDFDEDALAWALFSGFDDSLEAAFWNSCHALGACRVRFAVKELFFAKVAGGFLHVEEAVVFSEEDTVSNLFAEPVTRAEILINPNLHRVFSYRSWAPCGPLTGYLTVRSMGYSIGNLEQKVLVPLGLAAVWRRFASETCLYP